MDIPYDRNRGRVRSRACALATLALCFGAAAAAAQEPVCPDGASLLSIDGGVVEGNLGAPLPGATVLADARGEDGRWTSVASTDADAAGRFLICVDPSAGDSLRLQANALGSGGDPVLLSMSDVRASQPTTVRLPVYLGRDQGSPAAPAEAQITVESGGTTERYRVFGTVTDIEGGAPISAARVRLTSGAGETLTADDGAFSLMTTDAADTVVIEHFGYKTGRARIEPLSGTGVRIDAKLPPSPVELDPIVVGVSYHPRLRASGFYERRERGEKLGIGIYLGEKEIKDQHTNRISYLLDRVSMMETIRICTPHCLLLPKISTAPDKIGGNSVDGYVRSPCPADVYVNGTKARLFSYDQQSHLMVRAGIDEVGIPSELVGIEIYRRASELPAAFGGATEGCGAVVIWTK